MMIQCTPAFPRPPLAKAALKNAELRLKNEHCDRDEPTVSSAQCLGPMSIESPFFILSGDSQPARGSNITTTSQVATAPAITLYSFHGLQPDTS